MKISDFAGLENKIIHDTSFSSIGHLHGKNENRLVPINSTQDLNFAILSETIAGFIIPETTPIPNISGKGILLSPHPIKTALGIQKKIIQNSKIPNLPTRIHPSAHIHPSAIISDMNIVIQKNVAINEHVVINENSIIEKNSIIGANTIIGSIPKSYYPDPILKGFNPYGSVRIKQGVVIHAHCCIKKPWFQDTTTIGQSCHIDNLVTICQRRCKNPQLRRYLFPSPFKVFAKLSNLTM